MLHRFRRFIPVIVLGLAILTFGQTTAFAQANDSQAITLTPASTDISVDPGASTTKTVSVINGGSEPFNVTLTSAPYHVIGSHYDPQFTQLPGTVDASEWVTLSETKATVEASKTTAIPYTISVPKNTAPGGYYAIIFAETSSESEGTGVVSHNRVGNILYITVNGEIKSGGNLAGNTLPSFSFGGPISIGATISNSGGTHFVTNTSYTIKDLGGNEVFKYTAERYVLPQTQRDITYEWTPKALIGVFTVHRTATIAGESKSLPDQKIFMINPALLVAITFFLGLLIGLPLQRLRRRRRLKEK